MIHYKGTTSNVNTVIYDLSEDNNPYQLKNSSFQIAFEVSYEYQNERRYLTGSDSFLKLAIGQEITTIDNTGNIVNTEFIELDYSL